MDKIFLVKDRICKFSGGFTQIEGLDLLPSKNLESELVMCNDLKDKFKTRHGANVGDNFMIVGLKKVTGCSHTHLKVLDPEIFFHKLKDRILPDFRVVLCVTICVGSDQQDAPPIEPLITKEMAVRDKLRLMKDDEVVGSPAVDAILLNEQNKELFGKVSIHMTFPEHKLQLPIRPPVGEIYRKLIDENLSSDAAIVPGTGIAVPCHSSVLMAHSSVFYAMFESVMEEKRKCKCVQMEGMTEEGVEALVDYLYYEDDTEPNDKCSIAFELLLAGHHYDISFLESAMTNMIFDKPYEWFDVEVAIKLFMFARGMAGYSARELGIKALRVMQTNVAAVQQSASFHQLFREKPDIALELTTLILATWKNAETKIMTHFENILNFPN